MHARAVVGRKRVGIDCRLGNQLSVVGDVSDLVTRLARPRKQKRSNQPGSTVGEFRLYAMKQRPEFAHTDRVSVAATILIASRTPIADASM
jgi:hypothetical protein